MRIALIADIHGNLVALEAVLAELANEVVDQIICLGDVAATGPQPREVVARLRALDCLVVMGNADAWLLDPPRANGEADDEAGRIAAIDRWCAEQLSDQDRAYLRSFSLTIAVEMGGGERLIACHGSPRSFDDQITATTAEAALDVMLADVHATIVAAGHTHIQLVRRYQDLILLNPGSIGLPIDRVPPAAPIRNAPWAEYAMVSTGSDCLRLDLRRVPVEVTRLLTLARASAMPHAAWWCGEWG
jgi:putative phosphoesterase